jgi:hypothetical protein
MVAMIIFMISKYFIVTASDYSVDFISLMVTICYFPCRILICFVSRQFYTFFGINFFFNSNKSSHERST